MASSKPDDERLAGIFAAAENPQPAPDMTEGDGAPGPGDAFDVKDLPDDCPITALGAMKKVNYFLNYRGELIDLGTKFEKGEIMQLFGTRLAWCENQWPKWRKIGERRDDDGKVINVFEKVQLDFDQRDVQRAMILASAKLPPFDPTGRVRGRGAHRGDDGELVLHCGDVVLIGGRRGVKGRSKGSDSFKPGRVGKYIYPTLEALPRPAEQPASIAVTHQILDELESWNWARGKTAALLMFCWIGAACLGGALKNRPNTWIVGPSGAGKTTLQDFLRLLMGDWGVSTENATEAGVRQLLDQDTLAVMFDEIEAESDNQDVVGKILGLARLSYSGAKSVRGTADHKAKQFIARSCFLFSSIHHHEMPAQDRNRMAILHLSKFPKDTPKFVLPELTREWGDQLRRRLVEQWPRYDKTLAIYQAEMLRHGYEGREQDTYGTLLACGDLLLHDKGPDEEQDADRVWKRVKALAAIVDAARAEAESTSERCIKHLASHRLPAKPGASQETVAQLLQRHFIALHERRDGDETRRRLAGHGMRLVHLAADHEITEDGKPSQGGLVEAFRTDETSQSWLAVANKTNAGMQDIFAKSAWPNGVWTQALSLIDGSWQNKKTRFGGPPEGCVLVPLDALIDIEAAREEAERRRDEPPPPEPR